MKKEIEFLTKFDTSDFDRAVENMQRKLREVYRPADNAQSAQQTSKRLENMGLGGGLSKNTVDAFNKSMQQARRDMDKLISDEAKGQEKLAKFIAQREQKLKSLRKEQEGLVKGSDDELKSREKIARVEENLYRQREGFKARDKALNQAMDARQQVPPSRLAEMLAAFQGGRGGGLMGALNMMGGAGGAGMLGMLGMAGVGVAGAAALGKGAQMVGNTYASYNRIPLEVQSAQGSAMQNTFGREVGAAYSGRQGLEASFMPEKFKASQLSKQAIDAQMARDRALSISGAVPGGFAAGMRGGNLMGGMAGAAGGMAIGGYNFLTDERSRALDLSKLSGVPGLGGIGESYGKKYDSMNARMFAEDFAKASEDIKSQNPLKVAAAEDYQNNFMRNLQSQRAMGMGNEQFYGKGGFMEKAIDAGFTPEMAMQMSEGILGAGGSSRMARDPNLGLGMQRGMNLSNSSQILGTLSGGLGGSESTRQATVKLLSEGMKQGLDSSEFAEEQRRFAQTTAEIISKTGATGESDFERISQGFGRFLGEKTNMGIEGAKSAYEEYQGISATTTGARGVMRAAGFMRDPNLSKLSTIEKQALMQVPEEDLNENNMLVRGLAEKYGVPVKDFVKSVSDVNQGSVSRFKEHDEIRDRLRKKNVDIGKASTDEAYRSSLDKETRDDITELMSYQTTEHGYKGSRQMVARARGTVSGIAEEGMESKTTREAGIEDALRRKSDKIEDETIAGAAESAKFMLTNFREFKTQITPTAEAIAILNTQLKNLITTAKSMPEDQRNRVLQSVGNIMNPKNQSQSSKPSQ